MLSSSLKSSYIVAPRIAPSTGDEATPAQSRAEQSSPLLDWQCCAWWSSWQGWPFWLLGQCWFRFYLPQTDPQVTFYSSALQPFIPSVFTQWRLSHPSCRICHFPLLNLCLTLLNIYESCFTKRSCLSYFHHISASILHLVCLKLLPVLTLPNDSD